MEIGKETYSAPAHVRSASMDGTLILMEMKTGQYYSLDTVGPLVWGQLSLGKSVGEIVQAVALEYNAPEGLIEKDVKHLLATLLEAGLVLRNP